MTDIGVATRVHMREEAALVWYRFYRNIWLWQHSVHGSKAAERTFVMALHWRSRWSALREIIDAEERRAVATRCGTCFGERSVHGYCWRDKGHTGAHSTVAA